MISPHIRLEQILGRGATGAVWLASNVAMGGMLAVKVLDAAHESAVDTVRREASIIGRIQSPHIVQLYDVGCTDQGHAFIVMERLCGEDLASLLRRVGRLDYALTVAIISQAARGLAAAHRAGIVHRDVKPTNIFVVDNAEALPLVKLLDFGIAKVRDNAEPTITPQDAIVGTPSYMSPEQLENSSEVDASADLWSLAVVAYQCLTGSLPFRGDTVGARCYAISQGRYERATVVAPELPRAVDAWFLRALSRDRAARFASARELAASLATALGLAVDQDAEASAASAGRASEARFDAEVEAPREAALLERTAVEPIAAAQIIPPRSRRYGRVLGVAVIVTGLGAIATVVGVGVAGRSWLQRGKHASTGELALSGTAHFVPAGKIVSATLRSGDDVETIDVSRNGAFGFARRLPRGAAYEVTTNDPDCWIRNDGSDGGPVELDLRCRVIEERRSRIGPSNPAQTLAIYSTASATYEDVPLLDPIELDTDISAAVLVTLAVPANGFLRTETIVPSGTGEFALDVDGTIVEESEHRPMSEGQAAPNALIALVTLSPGHHVLRVRRRVDDLTTPSRFLDGDTIDGVTMEKVFHATVLESLETFRDVSVSSIGPQAESPPQGRMRSLQTTIRSEGVVLAGLHAPVFSALDEHGRTNGSLLLFANDDHIEAAVGAVDKLERSASLLWIAPYARDTSVSVSAGRGGAAPMLLPLGAHLFAATFRSSPDSPAPSPLIVSGLTRAPHATTTTVAQLRWSTSAPAKLLISVALARVYSTRDGGSGFVTLRHDGRPVSRVFFQSQSSGAGQGASMFVVVDVPPGPCTITLELESRLGDVFIGDDATSRSVLTALPLR